MLFVLYISQTYCGSTFERQNNPFVYGNASNPSKQKTQQKAPVPSGIPNQPTKVDRHTKAYVDAFGEYVIAFDREKYIISQTSLKLLLLVLEKSKAIRNANSFEHKPELADKEGGIVALKNVQMKQLRKIIADYTEDSTRNLKQYNEKCGSLTYRRIIHDIATMITHNQSLITYLDSGDATLKAFEDIFEKVMQTFERNLDKYLFTFGKYGLDASGLRKTQFDIQNLLSEEKRMHTTHLELN